MDRRLPLSVLPEDTLLHCARYLHDSDRRLWALSSRNFRIVDEKRHILLSEVINEVPVIEWALLQGAPWEGDIIACVAIGAKGALPTLIWAVGHDFQWDRSSTCQLAAQGGNLEVLQWAREQTPPCPWNVSTCKYAAQGGHLELLQWAHNHGCPWDEDTFVHAAIHGHIGVIQWAFERGCPWDKRIPTLVFHLLCAHGIPIKGTSRSFSGRITTGAGVEDIHIDWGDR